MFEWTSSVKRDNEDGWKDEEDKKNRKRKKVS